MNSYVVPLALFDENSASVMSDLFYVNSGWTGILRAYGFHGLHQEVETGYPRALTMACVNQVQMADFTKRYEAPCGVFIPADMVDIRIVNEGPVVTDGCNWAVSACHTLALIDIPGVYRLVLNNPSALGSVFVYLQARVSGSMSRASALFFGE
jgi:hypothetical protein